MSVYVWSAKNSLGQTSLKEVHAASAEEARAALLKEGYTDLELKEDDVMHAVQAGFPQDQQFLGETLKTTAADRIKYRNNPPTTFASVILKSAKESAGLFFLVAAIGVFSAFRGHWISVALLGFALVAWLAFLVCIGAPLVYYNKLIQAADWNRWTEMLSLIETVRAAGRFGIAKVPETELIRNQAKALAGLGRLSEALDLYKQCEGRPDCPGWLYKLFVAGLYDVARQRDKAIEYNLLAIQENPNSTAWIDLANRYARYKHNPIKAREALTEADKSPCVDVAVPFRTRCRGIISYLEGDNNAARQDLETAIDLVEKAKNRPFRDGHLSVARAYLCCVLAKLGDTAGARHNLSLARKYLEATEENELLGECLRLTA